MTRAHDQPGRKNADQIEQEAAEWLVKVDEDGTPEASRKLAAWLASNPRHRAAFLRISTAWRRADVMRRLAQPGEHADPDLLAPERPPAAESITEPARAQPTRTEPVHAEPARPESARVTPIRPHVNELPPPPRDRSRVAIAAGIGALLVGGGAWLTYTARGTQTYSTAVGEFHRVTLDDGSGISLNTNTKVRVSFTKSERRVELVQGEAQFEVAHDMQRPFLVHAGNTVVRAVGTAFVVRLRNRESVDVLVTEGRVAINPPSNNLVSAGELALVRKGSVTTRSVDDITRRVAWTEGMLIFGGETLAEAVEDFNRYNHRKLVIADPSIADQKIGGAFRSTSPDRFAVALKKTFGFEAHADETGGSGEIRLSRGGAR
jgi:transmembrane sensor